MDALRLRPKVCFPTPSRTLGEFILSLCVRGSVQGFALPTPSRTLRSDALRLRPKVLLPATSFILRNGLYRIDSRHLTLSKGSLADYLSHAPQWPFGVYMGDVNLSPKVRFSGPLSDALRWHLGTHFECVCVCVCGAVRVRFSDSPLVRSVVTP